MTKQEHLRKRRALYTGLKPYLNEYELMEALILWEKRYIDSPTFSVRYFISDLASSLKRPIESKAMLINLVSSLALSDSELLPDPAALLKNYKHRNQIDARPDYALPELEAFQIFVRKWISLAAAPSGADINTFVSRNLYSLRIDPELKTRIANWLVKRNYQLRMQEVNVSDLRKVINLFYIAFCEYLGPVKADELLAQAVKTLKSNGGAVYSTLFNKML